MKEYIEKTAARNAVKRVIGDQDHTCKAMMDFYVALNEVPAADVVELRHGRWGEYESFPLTQSLNEHPCSECGMHFSTSAIPVMKYCPNCGARMDKEDDHD